MSLDLLGQLNWLAVIVGAVIYFVIGAAWFSPAVFGRPWMAAIGWDESRQRPEMNPVSYAGPALVYRGNEHSPSTSGRKGSARHGSRRETDIPSAIRTEPGQTARDSSRGSSMGTNVALTPATGVWHDAAPPSRIAQRPSRGTRPPVPRRSGPCR